MTSGDDGQAPEQLPTPGLEIRSMEPNERIIRANGVDLCVQTFGDRADPPLLLVMGGASSMDWWEDGFCERLAAGSRFVIRYDHRDTGRSVSYEPGAAPYSLRDLAEDAVGLLDAFGLESASIAHVRTTKTLGDRRDGARDRILVGTYTQHGRRLYTPPPRRAVF